MRLPNCRGQTLAEFAIVLPILFLILMGLFDLGRAVFTYSALTNAAREGARLAIVNQDQALVVERAQGMAFGIEIETDPADVVTFWRQLPNTDDVTRNDECLGSTDYPMAVGCVAVVETDATWRAITPVIGGLIGPLTLVARSELPVEFVCPNPSIAAYATSDLCPKQP